MRCAGKETNLTDTYPTVDQQQSGVRRRQFFYLPTPLFLLLLFRSSSVKSGPPVISCSCLNKISNTAGESLMGLDSEDWLGADSEG